MRKRLSLIRCSWHRYPALVTFSILGVLASSTMLITPDSLIGDSIVFETWVPVLGHLVWPLFLGFGGILILRGIALHKPGSEAAGLILMAAAALSYAIALIVFRGSNWTDSFIAVTMFAGTGVAFLARAYLLVTEDRNEGE